MDYQDDRQDYSRNPTVDDLIRLCKSLNDAGVQYVVIGGFAVAHHGFLRTTGDIDLLIDSSPENVEKIRQALVYLSTRPGPLRTHYETKASNEPSPNFNIEWDNPQSTLCQLHPKNKRSYP